MNHLSGCSHCKGEAILYETTGIIPNLPRGWVVYCSGCDTCGHWDRDREVAVQLWNRKQYIGFLKQTLTQFFRQHFTKKGVI